jgi:hypothetical protein
MVTTGTMPAARAASIKSKGERGAMETVIQIACMAARCQGTPRQSFQRIVLPTVPPSRIAATPISWTVFTVLAARVPLKVPQAPGPRSTKPTRATTPDPLSRPTTNSPPQRTQTLPTVGGMKPQSTVGSDPTSMASQDVPSGEGVRVKGSTSHEPTVGMGTCASARGAPPPRGRRAT